MIKQLPNFVTSLRIIASPIIAILLLMQGNHELAFWIFAIAATTDWVDGFLARLLDAKSELGAKLDLLADKLLVGLVLPIMAISHLGFNIYIKLLIGIAFFIATSVRDYHVTNWRTILDKKNIKMPATFIAKTKTAVILIGMGIVLGSPVFKAPLLNFGWIVTIFGAILSLYTGYQYYKVYSKSS